MDIFYSLIALSLVGGSLAFFIEPKIPSEARLGYSDSTRIAKWIMRNSGGAIRDEKQANFALIIFSVAVILVSFYFIFFGSISKPPDEALRNPTIGLPAR